MMNLKNYLYVLLHYSVILLTQVFMNLNYLLDLKQLLIFQILLCHNRKKSVEEKQTSSILTLKTNIFHLIRFIVRNLFFSRFVISSLIYYYLLFLIFQSTHPFLVNIVFDTISSIILADNANYFLSGENLSPLTEVLYNKPNDVQLKIYDLLEFIIFQLKYIPNRELINPGHSIR